MPSYRFRITEQPSPFVSPAPGLPQHTVRVGYVRELDYIDHNPRCQACSACELSHGCSVYRISIQEMGEARICSRCLRSLSEGAAFIKRAKADAAKCAHEEIGEMCQVDLGDGSYKVSATCRKCGFVGALAFKRDESKP